MNKDPLTRLPGLKRLKGIKGINDLKKKRTPALPQPLNKPSELDLTDPNEKLVLSRLTTVKAADQRMAKRVAKLMRKYPNGTIPELIAMDWLLQENIEPYYLAQIFGGHQRRGGIEVDLLFKHNNVGVAWLVHGTYWHNRPEISESDKLEKNRFLGAVYHDILIAKVVWLWEHKIYSTRPEIFELGVIGIEIPE